MAVGSRALGDAWAARVTAPARVLVTGGTGFLGAPLVARLTERGHDVYPLARSGARLTGDLGDAAWLGAALAELRPAVVFHLAASTAGRDGSEGLEAALEANVRGSLGLFRAAAAAGCHTVVHASSAQVYGLGAECPHREDAAVRPASAYALSKAAVELIGGLFSTTTALGVVSLRFPVVYGPGQRPSMMIPDLVGKALRRERFLTTPGEQLRDYLYVDDAVSALLLASEAHAARGEVINVGSGRGVAVAEVVRRVLARLGDPIAPEGVLPYRAGEAMESYLDIAKAAHLLDCRPTTDLDTGLERTVAWYAERAVALGSVAAR